MQNIKYHSINIISVIIFSYITAITINEIIKYNISPIYVSKMKTSKPISNRNKKVQFENYNSIFESGMFKLYDPLTSVQPEIKSTPVGSVDNLKLVGTITGPPRIQRAFIKKRGEKYPKIFALWKINNNLDNDVYGYKLTRIRDLYVLLDNNGEKIKIFLYNVKKKNEKKGSKTKVSKSGRLIKKNLSRAEIKQKVFNNLDNALKGLVAGPYRKGGKIVGFRLKKVRPYNILYKFGARSGDIVKRINGRAANSTMKLMKMWQSLKTDSTIKVDIERRGKIVTFDFNITE